jgi:hypothetical protein
MSLRCWLLGHHWMVTGWTEQMHPIRIVAARYECVRCGVQR